MAAKSKDMRIIHDSISRTGNREINEDAVYCGRADGRFLFALADGLGGHGKGDQASQMAVATAAEVFSDSTAEKKDVLCEGFERGQAALLAAQSRARGDMKTTMVLLCMDNRTALWGHIGDSRLYYFHRGKILYRTKDHSVPQMLVAMGEITENDIRGHEDRNRLLKVMGTEWGRSSYEIAVEERTLVTGDTFLLCSDGFWEWIDEKRMERLLAWSSAPARWLAAMEREIRHNGAAAKMDNYSAIAVYVR